MRYKDKVKIMNKSNPKYHKVCQWCKTRYDLTEHHIKNNQGIKTGRKIILCRKHHDEQEILYQNMGIAIK